MITLKIADTLGTQQGCLFGALDAFCYGGQSEALGKTEEMAEKDPTLRPLCQIPHKGTIDLDNVDRQDLEMPQRGMPGAKIIECDTAAQPAQGVDKARRFLYIAKRCSFRDLDNEAARELGTVTQQRHQRPQPRPIASGQPGDVEAEPDVRVRREFLDCPFESVAVYGSDQTEFLDDGDKFASRDDGPLLVAHSQQAFEIIDHSGCRAYHRLECKH